MAEGNKGSRRTPNEKTQEYVLYEMIKKKKQSSMLRLAIWGQQYPEFDGRYIRHICALDDEEGNGSRFKFAEYGHMNK